jgi:2-polyprenyl-6-methoxyphenol hydroxylase-like FAD-dependent oxidoreductase
MLLARKGYRVLLVDKAAFPSDTISTHVIWPHGAEVLDRWGLFDRVAATGCPPIALNMIFDVGPFALKGGVRITNRGRGGLCPRRTVLDRILTDAAVESGAELRENFTVDSLITDNGKVLGIRGHGRNGATVEERASIVIGADGVHSFVAKAVGAPEYDSIPPLGTFFYSYFSGFDAVDIEQYVREYQGAACFPTNDGLTLLAAVWPSKRFKEIRSDIAGNVAKVHELAPTVKERLRSARQEERWVGTAGVPNIYRKPYGPGWALVGDAGHDQDPLTGQGISDAFLDAEALVGALDDGLSGRHPLEAALSQFHGERDRRTRPLHDFTCQLATLEPPPPEMQELFAAMRDNREATDQFYAALTGSLPVPEVMNPENIGRIMAAAKMAASTG